MKKRFTFLCWKCQKTYTLYREITEEQELIVACPFCNTEAVVDLQPFRKVKKEIFRSIDLSEVAPVFELKLPEIIPTSEREESDT